MSKTSTSEENRYTGVINQIGIERDANQYKNFNLTLGIKVKTEKKLSYTEGERLIKQLRKDLMGKNIELEPVAIPCPVCGRVFNTEFGMKQHQRMQHKNTKETTKKKRGRPKKKSK